MECSKSSCLKCYERPIQMEVMKPFTDFLNKCGGKWYSPTPVPETPAHYLTVQQVLNLKGNLETCSDQFIPSAQRSFQLKEIWKARSYVFSSKADIKRHFNLLHGLSNLEEFVAEIQNFASNVK